MGHRYTIQIKDREYVSDATRLRVHALIHDCFPTVVPTKPDVYLAHMTGLVIAIDDTDPERRDIIGAAVLDSGNLHPDLPAVFLMGLCVSPAFRNRGVATGMLDALRTHNVWTVLHIDKVDGHDALLDWYTRRGYVQLEHTRHIPLDPAVETCLVASHIPRHVVDLF
jgi:GNAT superfamily N-acetyltransferase